MKNRILEELLEAEGDGLASYFDEMDRKNMTLNFTCSIFFDIQQFRRNCRKLKMEEVSFDEIPDADWESITPPVYYCSADYGNAETLTGKEELHAVYEKYADIMDTSASCIDEFGDGDIEMFVYPRTLSTRESRNAFLEMVAEFQKVTGDGTAASGTYRDVINRRILKMDYATDGTLHFYISKQEKGTGREQADGRKPETDAEYISRRRKNQRSIPN